MRRSTRETSSEQRPPRGSDAGEASAGALLEVIDAVERAAAELALALGQLPQFLELARGELERGRPLEDVILAVMTAGGTAVRRDVFGATRQFEHSMQELRAESVWLLVNHGGLTITEVARRADITPQMVRRLYRSAEERRQTGPDV